MLDIIQLFDLTFLLTTHEVGPGNGADLVIQSSDGVLFHIDRRNLDRCAEAFPGSNATGITSESNDIVHLTETAEVLEILFQFGYPARHPVLDDLDFEKLLAVADAAEKYHFYSAAPMCQIVLRHNIPKHPIEVFRHAIKHDYPDDLIDEVARVLRPVPLTSASDPRIHPSVAPAWVCGLLCSYLLDIHFSSSSNKDDLSRGMEAHIQRRLPARKTQDPAIVRSRYRCPQFPPT
ncbi:hypothetical protein CPC08DRAFT_636803 [Agrocybe pediades]|nr:hypothetical protein CPC08DRAFT_636803 [Agrocybe pediades]